MAERLRVTAARIERERALRRVPLTRESKHRFLEALSAGLAIDMAADVAGVASRTLYRERERDPAFAQEWQDALESSVSPIERRLESIALDGDPGSMATVRAAETLLRGRSRRYNPKGDSAATVRMSQSSDSRSITVSLSGPSSD